jgi:hypothetical protein
MLYPEHIYQHKGCYKNNVLEYVRGFLNILNRDCENVDLKLLETVAFSRLLSSLRKLKLCQNSYFYDFLMTKEW